MLRNFKPSFVAASYNHKVDGRCWRLRCRCCHGTAHGSLPTRRRVSISRCLGPIRLLLSIKVAEEASKTAAKQHLHRHGNIKDAVFVVNAQRNHIRSAQGCSVWFVCLLSVPKTTSVHSPPYRPSLLRCLKQRQRFPCSNDKTRKKDERKKKTPSVPSARLC